MIKDPLDPNIISELKIVLESKYHAFSIEKELFDKKYKNFHEVNTKKLTRE